MYRCKNGLLGLPDLLQPRLQQVKVACIIWLQVSCEVFWLESGRVGLRAGMRPADVQHLPWQMNATSLPPHLHRVMVQAAKMSEHAKLH